ncbi:6244_t:CDS:2 [Rhizophagus irregularis]|nr:6244_t:CDS:2 [Rhizophagus irregularis]
MSVLVCKLRDTTAKKNVETQGEENNNNSTYDFYNGKTSWNGSNNTFRELSHQYLFIPVKRNETLEEAYARITVESEELMEKSNGEINMKITENYLKTTLELFCPAQELDYENMYKFLA